MLKITIEGDAEEIAALVLELRERHSAIVDIHGEELARKIIENISRQTESSPIFR